MVGGGGDKKAEVILVRTVNAEPKDGLYRRRMRFHQVDLSEGKLNSNCFPSILTRIGDGAMVRSDGPVVYLIGGLIDGPIDEPGSDDVYYKGCCCLDVQKEGRGWEHIDLPIKNRMISNCASLFGKLYELGYPRLDTPEVFDPSIGSWKELSPLPLELVGCRVSDGVIPDPCNSRLLVHLSQGKLPSCNLYAFYPDSGEWERIGSLLYWSNHNVALVDGVLYIHDSESRGPFIYAFDVARRQGLKVTWSSRMYGGVNVTEYEYEAMFYAGDSHFMMAIWTPPNTRNNVTTGIIFFKFKVDRSEINGLHIVCTPVEVQSRDLHINARVSGSSNSTRLVEWKH